MFYTDPHSPILEWDTLANVVIMYNNKPNNNELFSMAQKLSLHIFFTLLVTFAANDGEDWKYCIKIGFKFFLRNGNLRTLVKFLKRKSYIYIIYIYTIPKRRFQHKICDPLYSSRQDLFKPWKIILKLSRFAAC